MRDLRIHAGSIALQVREYEREGDAIIFLHFGGAKRLFEEHGWWNEHVAAAERYGAYEIGQGQYTQGMPQQAGLDYMAHYYECRFEDYYRRVKCPVLMVSDEEDAGEEPMKTAMKGLAALAGAEIVVPPGC